MIIKKLISFGYKWKILEGIIEEPKDYYWTCVYYFIVNCVELVDCNWVEGASGWLCERLHPRTLNCLEFVVSSLAKKSFKVYEAKTPFAFKAPHM